MITTELGELLGEQEIDAPHACVYVVRDRKTIFYIGRTSRGIAYRLFEHCGKTNLYPWPDGLGQFIQANAPASDAWQVDLMTMRDCAPYIKKYNRHFVISRCNETDAERALIKEMRPCLNIMLNPRPRALPKRYKRASDPIEDFAAAADLVSYEE